MLGLMWTLLSACAAPLACHAQEGEGSGRVADMPQPAGALPMASLAADSVVAQDALSSTSRDMSHWLLDGAGFLPVPIVLTDPAIGAGGGLAAVFMRRPRHAASQQDGDKVSPHLFGLGAFRTSDGSRGFGAGAQLHLDEDRWRYLGVAGHVSMNLDYYGPQFLHDGGIDLAYTLTGITSVQKVQRQLGSPRWYAGLAWIYLDLEVGFDHAPDRQRLPETALGRRSSGLATSLEYDSRDTTFTPSRGVFSAIDATFFTRGLGSDSDYRHYSTRTYAYWPLWNERLVIGARAQAQAVQGDVPFYRLPYVDLRGIGAMRYQGTRVLTLETEWRWNFAQRWAAVAFVGAGRAWGRREAWRDADNRIARGVGARYRVAEELGLYVGVDYARGPDDDAFYVQVGSAWR